MFEANDVPGFLDLFVPGKDIYEWGWPFPSPKRSVPEGMFILQEQYFLIEHLGQGTWAKSGKKLVRTPT